MTHALQARYDGSEDGTGRGIPLAFGGGNCSGPLAAAAVNAGGTGRMDFESETLVVGFNGDQSEHTRSMGERIEQSPTLRSDAPAHVCFPVQYPDQALRDKRQNGIGIGDDGAPSYTLERTFRQGVGVRRLTPRECERLQGFPDDYTAITFKGKPASDAARYRALGNSMAVPVMRWIGERIQMAAQWSNLGAET